MKTSIYARVAAKAINFPDDIELFYHCLDEQNQPTGEGYRGLHFTWDEVRLRYLIDAEYAKECEGIFRDGHAAFIGNRDLVGKFGGPDEHSGDSN
jgi:hypothetical protein